MNQRIDNFCLEAGLFTKLTNGRNYPVSMSAEESQLALAEFAKLIIHECVTVCKEESKWLNNTFGDHCAAQIKDHFE